MTGRRRLPQNMAPGIFAAEIATWAAVSPSLLPRPWWVTAANVAIGQGVGHLAATTAAFITKRGLHAIGKRPQDRVGPTLRSRTHLALGAITLAVGMRSLRNQSAQAKLVNKHNERGPESAFLGIALGTVGYGTLLIVGEAAQITVTQLSRGFSGGSLVGRLAVGRCRGQLRRCFPQQSHALAPLHPRRLPKSTAAQQAGLSRLGHAVGAGAKWQPMVP